MGGFYIKKVVVKGNDLIPAKIKFEKGVNLITGDSDTGKSFLFATLNYLLGGGEPKNIRQSHGYSEYFMEICTFEGNHLYTFKRSIGSNLIEVKEVSILKFPTSEKGYKKYKTTGSIISTDNIQNFLLSLLGLNDKRLLKNKNGKTENLSYNNLKKLTFVDEERILKSSSPFYLSGQYTKQTVEQSLLSLLLTGADFSEEVEKEDKKYKETRINGKLEFLSSQITLNASKKEMLNENLIANYEELDDSNFSEIDDELKKAFNNSDHLSFTKTTYLKVKEDSNSKLVYKKELLYKFVLLEEQYNADIERIEFIMESESLSSQLGDTVCPLCSTSLDDNHILHLKEQEEFKEAAIKELEKNKTKTSGLKDSINELKKDITLLEKEVYECDNAIQEIQKQFQDEIIPKIKLLKQKYNKFIEYSKVINNIEFIDKSTTELFTEKERLEGVLRAKEPKEEEAGILKYSVLKKLTDRIQARLQNWNYEPNISVDFDSYYKIFDIVISGNNRRNYGKGKRAISYAASLIGLLDYCKEESKKFTNLIVLDSPLTTFDEKRKKDNSEAIDSTILKSFFLDIVNVPDNSQIIIFDNKEPDAETLEIIKDKIKIEVFTGNKGEGRYGFFPSN